MTPWRWLQQATALLRARPRALLGATSLLLAVALAPSVLQLALAGLSPAFAQVLSVLMSLLVYPPAVAGYYRLLHALVQGGNPAPSSLFAVFNDGACVRRMIIANIIIVCGALLFFSLLFWAFGGEQILGFLRQLAALQPGAKDLPTPPAAIVPLTVVVMLFGAAMMTVQGLVFAELALGWRPPLSAIGSALRTTARHFGLLLLFYVPVSVLAFLGFMFVALTAALFGAALGLLAPALGSLVVIMASLLVALLLYALLFSFFYFAWRELSGEAPPPSAPDAQHEIAA
jgi:hypothetical protein